MSKFADDLIASLKQAAAHAEGRDPEGVRITTVIVHGLGPVRPLTWDLFRRAAELSDGVETDPDAPIDGDVEL